jgi:hypothetical protein
MSLYNMVCGNNPLYQLYHAILSTVEPLPPIPRYRDTYVEVSPAESATIIIYTRTGGGNREVFEEENEALAKHPLCLGNYDDDFDPTFAHFVFSIPEDWHDRVVDLQGKLEKLRAFRSPSEKFQASLSEMREGRQSDAVSLTNSEAAEVATLLDSYATELGLKPPRDRAVQEPQS